MKAAMIDKYGSAKEIHIRKGIKIPSLGTADVLVKTIAAGINAGDIEVRKGHYKLLTPFGKKKRETLLGIEFSGEVISVGSGVNNFKPGDEVYGSTHVFKGSKTNAEYVSVPARYIAPKPLILSHEEAAALPTGMITSIRAFRDIANLQKNQTVLINGASGAVGIYAIQLAKALGAKITTVSSEINFEFVESLGADKTLDYKNEDFTKLKERFDIVFDVAGTSSFSACRKILKNKGIYINTNPQKDVLGFVSSLFSSKKSGYLMAVEGSRHDLKYTNKLIEQRKIKPLVGKVFAFSKIVEAHEYFEKNSGKVVLNMEK